MPTGTLISPEWAAWPGGSSTKTSALSRIAGSSSCLPGGASAPIALMCVPSWIQSAITTGFVDGVVVVSTSQSQARSIGTLRALYSE